MLAESEEPSPPAEAEPLTNIQALRDIRSVLQKAWDMPEFSFEFVDSAFKGADHVEQFIRRLQGMVIEECGLPDEMLDAEISRRIDQQVECEEREYWGRPERSEWAELVDPDGLKPWIE